MKNVSSFWVIKRFKISRGENKFKFSRDGTMVTYWISLKIIDFIER